MDGTHTISIPLSNQRIADQIIGALEGGSGYWATGFYLESSAVTPVEKPWYADPKLYGGEFKIRVEIDDDEPVRFTHENLKTGLSVLATKYPTRLAEILNENDDAETSDVFLQACLFGEIVYG